ncbi:MAG: LysR family transcriptional regulator [Rhodospirillales bacterium]|nr:LysR family transcriptional regulator [Rhodospirillales bacterium]
MTLDQLRVFVAVAERSHVTRAAEALHLAQSAASAAIAALEARHGARLFHRVGRRIELTEAGRAFLPEARAVLARAEAAELALAALAGQPRGVLNVAASQTIAAYWLPRHLVAFHRAWPEVEIRLAPGNTEAVAAAVAAGAAELGFVEGEVARADLVERIVAHDRLVLVVGPEHPWTTGPKPDAAALAAAEWVLREPGSGTRSAFESAMAARGAVPPGRLRVALELPTNEAVRAAVEAGAGATAISAAVAAPGLEAGLLHLVDAKFAERAYRVLRHRERAPGAAAAALLARVAG